MLEVEQVDKSIAPEHLVGKVRGPRLDQRSYGRLPTFLYLNGVPCLLDDPL